MIFYRSIFRKNKVLTSYLYMINNYNKKYISDDIIYNNLYNNFYNKDKLNNHLFKMKIIKNIIKINKKICNMEKSIDENKELFSGEQIKENKELFYEIKVKENKELFYETQVKENTNHIETLYFINGVWMISITVYIFIITYKKLI